MDDLLMEYERMPAGLLRRQHQFEIIALLHEKRFTESIDDRAGGTQITGNAGA